MVSVVLVGVAMLLVLVGVAILLGLLVLVGVAMLLVGVAMLLGSLVTTMMSAMATVVVAWLVLMDMGVCGGVFLGCFGVGMYGRRGVSNDAASLHVKASHTGQFS